MVLLLFLKVVFYRSLFFGIASASNLKWLIQKSFIFDVLMKYTFVIIILLVTIVALS